MLTFKHREVNLPDDCIHNISPSCINKFFQYPKLYYEENVLGKPSSFKGNTSSTIGTICHYIAEQYTLGLPVTREDINSQLDIFVKENPDLNIDTDEVKANYPPMANALVNGYLIPNETSNVQIECEKTLLHHIKNGVYVGGTCDRVEGSCVVDYKTSFSRPANGQIFFPHKIQLLAYAYILRKQGYLIDRIRVVHVVRPKKTIGARCIPVTEMISYTDEKLIKDTLELITDSVLKVKENPDLAYLIFKSMELKNAS